MQGRSKRRIWAPVLALLVAATTGPPASAESVDRVAARVNGEIVTEGDLRQALKDRGQSSLSPDFLKGFLDRKLLIQEAQRQKITVSDNDLERQVESAVRDIRSKYPDEKSFRKALADEGMSLEQFKADLMKRAKTDHQVFQAVASGSKVSDREVKEFERSAQAASASASKVQLRRLGVEIKKGAKDDACDRARELVGKITAEGLSFEDGVRKYSAVPGAAADGGDLGWMDPGQLSTEVAEAVRDLKSGQASAPIITGGYASVFYVEGKRGGRAQLLESRFNHNRDALIQKLRSQAHIDLYSEKMLKAMPKEYSGRAREQRATVQGVGHTPIDTAPAAAEAALQAAPPQATPAPTPSPTPARKGFFSNFRKSD